MNSINMEHFCILCGQSTEHEPFYQRLKQCKTCSLVSANEIPGREELETVYGKHYFFDGEYLDYLEEKKAFQKNFRKWIMLLRRFVPHGKLFEIGSAYGFFLELARNVWEAKGVDISGPACEYGKSLGLNVECGDFLDIPVEAGQYNLFCLWDTIEHLKRPDLYIKKIRETIAPGGIICLTTGDIDAIVPRIQRGKWRMIHPPTHLYYFSKKTLYRLLAKNHFEVLYSSHVGFYRSLKRVFYNLALFNKGPWETMFEYYQKLNLKDFSIYLNLFDILLVIARKES
jgi:SAM-dependent methyltransferase